MKTVGTYVRTKNGETGFVLMGEPAYNGKVIVHLIDPETFAPVIGEDKKEKKILSDPATLVVTGYFHKRS